MLANKTHKDSLPGIIVHETSHIVGMTEDISEASSADASYDLVLAYAQKPASVDETKDAYAYQFFAEPLSPF
jgi:hypothetical protein